MLAEPLAPVQLEQLRSFSTCLVASAIETFGVRLHNKGFSDSRLRCIFDDLPPIVGYAATARIRSSDPPMEGGRYYGYYDRGDWWASIAKIPHPRVVVIEDIDTPTRSRRAHRRGSHQHSARPRMRRGGNEWRRPRSAGSPPNGVSNVRWKYFDIARLRPPVRFWRVRRNCGSYRESRRSHSGRFTWGANHSPRNRQSSPREGFRACRQT